MGSLKAIRSATGGPESPNERFIASEAPGASFGKPFASRPGLKGAASATGVHSLGSLAVELAPDRPEGELAELRGTRADLGSADQVGRRTVFNISGNKYRLVARVNYRTQRTFIPRIMNHAEYAKGGWK